MKNILGVALAIAAIYVGGCSTYNLPTDSPEVETKGGAISKPELPIEGPKLIANGENKELIKAESLEKSLIVSDTAHLWFVSGDNSETRIEFPPAIKEHLSLNWKYLIRYRYAKDLSNSQEQVYQATRDSGIATINLMNALREIEIDRAGTQTKLREDEIQEILDLQAHLLANRYSEIRALFPDIVDAAPKSS